MGREQLMKGFMGPAEEFEPYSEDRSRIPAKDGAVASRRELSVTVSEFLCLKARVKNEDRVGNED